MGYRVRTHIDVHLRVVHFLIDQIKREIVKGGNVQPTITQGCAYTKSIHSGVIVGLVEASNCV